MIQNPLRPVWDLTPDGRSVDLSPIVTYLDPNSEVGSWIQSRFTAEHPGFRDGNRIVVSGLKRTESCAFRTLPCGCKLKFELRRRVPIHAPELRLQPILMPLARHRQAFGDVNSGVRDQATHTSPGEGGSEPACWRGGGRRIARTSVAGALALPWLTGWLVWLRVSCAGGVRVPAMGLAMVSPQE